jgi:hypothetical protein
MVGDQDANIPGRKVPDDALNIQNRYRVYTGKWFIQQDETWLCRQRSRDFDTPTLAAGQADAKTVPNMMNMELIE